MRHRRVVGASALRAASSCVHVWNGEELAIAERSAAAVEAAPRANDELS